MPARLQHTGPGVDQPAHQLRLHLDHAQPDSGQPRGDGPDHLRLFTDDGRDLPADRHDHHHDRQLLHAGGVLMGWFRQRQRGQAIVIMALAMVAICGMLALAIDAGRLYFQRRLMQDAVDAGALAGAQDLVGTLANPNGNPPNALFHALQDTFSVFGLTPTNPQGSAYYNNPPLNTVTDTRGNPPYTVTAVAPSGLNNKKIQVTVTYNAVP